MLNEAICGARVGKEAKRRAMFVRAPVATRWAVPGGYERRADRMASRKGVCVIGGEEAVGRRSVPSRPEIPGVEVLVLCFRIG